MLTGRQRQLVLFIQDYHEKHGIYPSFDEMREALELKSKSGIHRLVSGLEERGYLRRLAYRARAIELVRDRAGEPAAEAPVNVVRGRFRRELPPEPACAPATSPPALRHAGLDLPLYGKIAAGTPIEALADTTTTIDVPQFMLGEGEHYVLQVRGDSMIDAGIADGDLVVIQRSDTAESGAIVVALIEDREVTLKRLRKRGASIALEAANPTYETRIFGPHQVKVQGRLVGLMRRY
ncbi:transcriptional repressor LexA [Geminicoccus flavidas]|uniref:transcriptional repressor LexA n=1 Tax=Geminicoccus flavidas TaxID=2506407 RepID=UPI00135896DD|nr:transcriptional repressor LexA [Geminicoccus flavidas]